MYDALRFVGKNPSYVLGKDETESYNPDYIWFAKLPSQTVYKPWGVTSPNADGTTTSGTIISVKILNTNELTEPYVHSFFGSNEAFYVNLFKKPIQAPQKPQIGTKPNAKPNTTTATTTKYSGGTIKLIIVANTLDQTIGSTCQQDLTRVKKTFTDIAAMLKLNFSATEIKGQDFGKLAVVNAMSKLSSNPSDIIVFCYTGHGFHYERDLNNPYPQFDFRRSAKQDVDANTMNLIEVTNALKIQKAHLKLVLADCCNTFLETGKLFGRSNPSTVRSTIQWSKSNCENLFMRQSGTVVVSAASIGEIARCNEEYGGFFLFNFLKSLDKSLSVFASGNSWQNIISETKETVLEMSRQGECQAKVCTQTAVSHIVTK
jgi:hypothetical protein